MSSSKSFFGKPKPRRQRITLALINKIAAQKNLNPKEKKQLIKAWHEGRVSKTFFGLPGEDQRTLRRLTQAILIQAGIILPLTGPLSPVIGSAVAGAFTANLAYDFYKDRKQIYKNLKRRDKKITRFLRTKNKKTRNKLIRDFEDYV